MDKKDTFGNMEDQPQIPAEQPVPDQPDQPEDLGPLDSEETVGDWADAPNPGEIKLGVVPGSKVEKILIQAEKEMEEEEKLRAQGIEVKQSTSRDYGIGPLEERKLCGMISEEDYKKLKSKRSTTTMACSHESALLFREKAKELGITVSQLIEVIANSALPKITIENNIRLTMDF